MRLTPLVLVALSFVSGLAQAATSYNGTLTLPTEKKLELVDTQGTSGVLSEGPVALRYQKPGMTGFIALFNGHRQILISQNGTILTFDLQSSDFNSFGEFRTKAAKDQKFSLAGRTQKEPVRVHQEELEHSCTYAGYCHTCTTELKADGKLAQDCGFKFSALCFGSQKIRGEITDYRLTTSIAIIDNSTSQVVGQITGAPTDKSEVKVLQELSACGG